MKYINLNAFTDTTLEQQPYPHLALPNMIQTKQLDAINASFPNITQGGSFPLDQVETQGAFNDLISELQSDEFRESVAKKFSVNLEGRPTMITLRGISREKDGQIHTDSKTKIITVLVYLNPQWQAEPPAGCLRILKDGKNIENFTDQIEPKAGTCVAFKVTDNCWHGYKSFDGTRRSIQLNYLTSEKAATKHLFFHSISAKIKAFKKRLFS